MTKKKGFLRYASIVGLSGMQELFLAYLQLRITVLTTDTRFQIVTSILHVFDKTASQDTFKCTYSVRKDIANSSDFLSLCSCIYDLCWHPNSWQHFTWKVIRFDSDMRLVFARPSEPDCQTCAWIPFLIIQVQLLTTRGWKLRECYFQIFKNKRWHFFVYVWHIWISGVSHGRIRSSRISLVPTLWSVFD